MTELPAIAVVEATTGAFAAIEPSAKEVELAVPETPQTNEADNCAVPPLLGEASVISVRLKVVVPLTLLQDILVRVIAYCFLKLANAVSVAFIKSIERVPETRFVDVEIVPAVAFNAPVKVELIPVRDDKVIVPLVATLPTAKSSPTLLEAVTVNGLVPHIVNAPVKVFGDNEDTPAAGVVDVPKTPAVR